MMSNRRIPGMARRTEESLRDQGWFRWKKLLKMANNINNIKVPAIDSLLVSFPGNVILLCNISYFLLCLVDLAL
jgi:hypothetical protein